MKGDKVYGKVWDIVGLQEIWIPPPQAMLPRISISTPNKPIGPGWVLLIAQCRKLSTTTRTAVHFPMQSPYWPPEKGT